MVAVQNYVWEQGADLVMAMIYKQGPEGAQTPVDLTGYALRMDIVNSLGARLYTFNSADIPDVDSTADGAQPDATKEVTLGAAGEITIVVPRSLTLPGGAVYADLNATPPRNSFNYDIFLRDTLDIQKKILRGQITVEKSYTLWE